MDAIDSLRAAENEMYEQSKCVLGDAVSLIQDTDELYGLLVELVQESKTLARDEAFIGMRLLFQCQYELRGGSLDLLRAHFRDAQVHVRQAVEACAFARRIKADPKLAKLWVQDVDIEGPWYEEVRKRFGPKKLFPKNDPKLTKLHERWKMGSRMSHSSFFALAKATDVQFKPGMAGIGLHFFDVQPGDDGTEMRRHLLYLTQVHLLCLRVFEDVFPEAIAHDRGKWELHWNAVEGKLEFHLSKLLAA